MKLFEGLLIASFLGACSTPNNILISNPPPNYRQVIADYLPKISGLSRVGAGISDIRPSIGGQLGNWTTCIKANTFGKTAYYAIFLTENPPSADPTRFNKSPFAIEPRLSVKTDRCEHAVYSRLPPRNPNFEKLDSEEKELELAR